MDHICEGGKGKVASDGACLSVTQETTAGESFFEGRWVAASPEIARVNSPAPANGIREKETAGWGQPAVRAMGMCFSKRRVARRTLKEAGTRRSFSNFDNHR